jgi:glycosyltransferase involved in cell wall biosynthesis
LDEFNLFNSFVVLQVGMLTPLKNQMESVKTIEKLKIEIPNIKLVLAGWGEGTYIKMLKEYIREKNLDDNVIITGQLSRESVRDLYHASHLLLHPIKSQGGWLAPFESLCAQKPIVVSLEMTASNIIKREEIGIVTEDFAGAIWDVYSNPDKYCQTAIRGKEWVRENLSWDKFCERMLNLFLKAIKKG